MAGKKQVKKNTKPIVVSIDDQPLIDTSNLDTAVNVTSTKKDVKKSTTNTSSPVVTSPKVEEPKKQVEEPKKQQVEPVTISASTSNNNVVIAPGVEAQITDDFSVVPEKNKNKKKINENADGSSTTTTATAPKPVVRPTISNAKKGNTAPRSQFHLLSLDEDDVTYDETHTHFKEPEKSTQQHSNKKSSKSQKATESTASSKKSKSKETKKVAVETPSPVVEKPKASTKSSKSSVVEQPKAVKKAAVEPTSSPKQTINTQQSKPQQNKKSEGAMFDLMESLITPGIPTVVYKIIYFALIGVLLFSLVPLYYSGLNSLYSLGVVAIVLGLGITLTLFIGEVPKLQAEKETRGKGKKPSSRKLK